jgi:hypothetical protein
MIRKASREEFVEDSEASLNSFLRECFDKSLELKAMQKKCS